MRRHRTDLVSLLFGLIFVVVGLSFVASPDGVTAIDWSLVAGFVGLAAGAGIVASLVRSPEVAAAEPATLHPGVDPLPDSDSGYDPFDPFGDIDPEILAEIRAAAEQEADEAARSEPPDDPADDEPDRPA